VDIPGDDDPDVSGNVFTEKGKHEPEEFDPDSLGPPTPTPSEADYQSDVAGLFVKLVVVFNVALLALALGPMLAYFRGQVDLGARIFLVGVVAFSYGTYEYVKFTRRETDDEREGESRDDAETESGSEEDDPERSGANKDGADVDARDQRDGTGGPHHNG
jgi:hypothetical protein